MAQALTIVMAKIAQLLGALLVLQTSWIALKIVQSLPDPSLWLAVAVAGLALCLILVLAGVAVISGRRRNEQLLGGVLMMNVVFFLGWTLPWLIGRFLDSQSHQCYGLFNIPEKCTESALFFSTILVTLFPIGWIVILIVLIPIVRGLVIGPKRT
jgi:hypothetical protein